MQVYTDKELITALQQGDERVFESVFKDYYARLCNYALSLLKDSDEAEEVVQQFFAALWEKRSNIKIQLSLKAYFYKSVYNACLNKLKQTQMKLAHHQEELIGSESAKTVLEPSLFTKELEKQIALAIESLPEQCRIIFKLSRFEELKYAEIAGQLNLSIKTVENQMGKALRVLRENLKEYLPTLIALLLITYFLN